MEDAANAAPILSAGARIPIAQLNPSLPTLATGLVKAVVTLIWPYSSSTRSLTVLLAEPDFRLRRNRGQVRVQFLGSSARHVFKAGIGSGDEVLLSLDGASWVKDETTAQTPGRSIEWELHFTEKLVIQIQESETQKLSTVNIDHPPPDPDDLAPVEVPNIELPIPTQTSVPPSSARPQLSRSETVEWSSPAFIKRARVSYGALFETGHDAFSVDDGTVPGVGRKRTRFSRESGDWRYVSRSPSPDKELKEPEMDADSTLFEEKPAMMDEAVQTQILDEAESELRSDNRHGGVISYEETFDPGHDHDVSSIPQLQALSANVENQAVTILPSASGDDEVHSSAEILAVPPLASAGVMESSNVEVLHDPADQAVWHEQYGFRGDGLTTHIQGQIPEDIYGMTPPHQVKDVHDHLEEPPNTQQGSYNAVESLEFADQYGHWQGLMAAQDQLSRSRSPSGLHGESMPSYPEPEPEEELSSIQHEGGPYYEGDKFPVHYALQHLEDHPDEARDQLQAELLHETRSIENQHLPQKGNLHLLSATAAQTALAPAAVAMSRSQSGRSETIDLTEDSDEEAESSKDIPKIGRVEEELSESGFNGNQMQTRSISGFEGGDEREEDDEDIEGDEDAEMEEALDEVEEDEDASGQSYDEEYSEEEIDNERLHYPPGFRPVYERRTGQQDEDDEEAIGSEEEEDDGELEAEYEADDVNERHTPAEPGEPVVIDLLSSDDEGEEPEAELEEDEREVESGEEESIDENISKHLERPTEEDEEDEEVIEEHEEAEDNPHDEDMDHDDTKDTGEDVHGNEIDNLSKLSNEVEVGAAVEIQYPVLPDEETVNTSTGQVVNSKDYDEVLDPSKPQHVHQDQLPTPEDTQANGGIELLTERQEPADIEKEPESAPLVDETAISSFSALSSMPHPPSTPTRSTAPSVPEEFQSAKSNSTISVMMGSPKSPEDYDPSAEIAMDALDSPTKRPELSASGPAVRSQFMKALRTNLGEFTRLKVLRFHLEKKLDVLGIATTQSSEPQRAKNGPRHYHLRFNVTDPSIGPGSVSEIQIFRPYREALPIVQAGDGLLLRNFQVKAEKGRGFVLRSDDSSSWVVFKKDGTPEVRGPPVEFGDGEQEHILSMKSWFGDLNETELAKLRRANGEKSVQVSKATAKAF